MKKVKLNYEVSNGTYWGRVKYKGNLITDCADSLDALQKNMKSLIYDFHNVEVELEPIEDSQ